MTGTAKSHSKAVLLCFGCALFVYLLVRLGAPEILALLLGVGWCFALIAAIYGCHQLIRTIALRECITAKEHASFWDI